MVKYAYYVVGADGVIDEYAGQRELFAAIKSDELDADDVRIFRGKEVTITVEETTIKRPVLEVKG